MMMMEGLSCESVDNLREALENNNTEMILKSKKICDDEINSIPKTKFTLHEDAFASMHISERIKCDIIGANREGEKVAAAR